MEIQFKLDHKKLLMVSLWNRTYAAYVRYAALNKKVCLRISCFFFYNTVYSLICVYDYLCICSRSHLSNNVHLFNLYIPIPPSPSYTYVHVHIDLGVPYIPT